jgi:hypothetical protein
VRQTAEVKALDDAFQAELRERVGRAAVTLAH